jgi:hypothetical protein
MQWSSSVVSKLQATLPVLAGAGLFAGIVTASMAQRAQCTPPDPAGCLLEFGQVETMAFTDPSITHTWTVDVPDQMDFTVILRGAVVNLDLVAYGPDGSALAESRNPGATDEIIDVPAAAPGTYTVEVTSPEGLPNEQPYVIIARRGLTNAPPGEAPAVNPYDLPSMTETPSVNAYDVPSPDQ